MLIGATPNYLDGSGNNVRRRIAQVVFLVLVFPARGKFCPYGVNRHWSRRFAVRWKSDA